MAKGASIQLDDLISVRHVAETLKLKKQPHANSPLAGNIRTRFRGRGLEFEEVRHYQAGDELRTLDWRITARTGVPHTKIFREEREKPTLIVVDQRYSMAFGSRCCFKSVIAAETAALLAWSAFKQNDRIGGFVFNDSQQYDLRPANSRKTVLKLLDNIATFNQRLVQKHHSGSNVEQINIILNELNRTAKPGSTLFIISDFIGLSDDGIKQLNHLKRHCDIHALIVSDTLEKNLPQIGHQIFSDGQQQYVYDTNASQLQQLFSSQFEQRIQRLHTQLNDRGIGTIELSTQSDPLQVLFAYFGHHIKSLPVKINDTQRKRSGI